MIQRRNTHHKLANDADVNVVLLDSKLLLAHMKVWEGREEVVEIKELVRRVLFVSTFHAFTAYAHVTPFP